MSSDDKSDMNITPPSNGVEPGTQIIGTYEVRERIAAGGMGEVYRGVNIHTDEPVAIKIVLPGLAHDQKIISMFQKEATVLSRLSHDAIVRYHVFTIDPIIKRPCLIMEFVDGISLAKYIEGGRALPEHDVRVLLARVASGLAKAHKAGVIHRDLSPDNVILREGTADHATIIDFGIAKAADIGGGTLLGGQFAGKYNFVSPEQLGRFKGVVTGRSDIYSLGLVAAAACRGEVLDMGDSPAGAVEMRLAVPELDGVSDGLRPLIAMMLEPDPDHRPESMDSIVTWLAAQGGIEGAVPGMTSTPPEGGGQWQLSQPPSSLPPSSLPPLLAAAAAIAAAKRGAVAAPAIGAAAIAATPCGLEGGRDRCHGQFGRCRGQRAAGCGWFRTTPGPAAHRKRQPVRPLCGPRRGPGAATTHKPGPTRKEEGRGRAYRRAAGGGSGGRGRLRLLRRPDPRPVHAR